MFKAQLGGWLVYGVQRHFQQILGNVYKTRLNCILRKIFAFPGIANRIFVGICCRPELIRGQNALDCDSDVSTVSLYIHWCTKTFQNLETNINIQLNY
jgi:hypothetical protein